MTRCGWPAVLAGKAVAGIITAVDREHREVVTTNRARVGGQPDPCGVAGVGVPPMQMNKACREYGHS